MTDQPDVAALAELTALVTLLPDDASRARMLTILAALRAKPAGEVVDSLRTDLFAILRRHDVSDQCFAEVAMVTQALRTRPAAEGVREALCIAALDALSGWRYIRSRYGDMDGVGWDRVENALTAALADQPASDAPERGR